MIIFTDPIEKVGFKAWRFDWAGVGVQPYRLYLEGREIVTLDGISPTTETQITLNHDDAEEPPELEVIDSTEELPSNLINSPRTTIQWRGIRDLASYRVEQLNGSWVTVSTAQEDGRGYYRYETEPLTDATTAQFRVIGEDGEGGETHPLSFDFFPVRNVPVPSITMTYSKPNLTFSAR